VRRASPLRFALTVAVGLALVVGLAWGRWAVSLAPERLWGAHNLGLTAAGGLVGGRSLAPWGPDLRTHSHLLGAVGRQYLHPDLARLLAVAAAEERSAMAKRRDAPVSAWRVAETGWRSGGWFPPHLTHQDGLAVDVMTPLVEGRLPSGPGTLLGYAVDLGEDGSFGETRADVERLARFFDALCTNAGEHGLVVRRLTVWAPWQGAIRGRMRSTCRRNLADAALPHDDHVHVLVTRSGHR